MRSPCTATRESPPITATRESPPITATRERPVQQQKPSTTNQHIKLFFLSFSKKRRKKRNVYINGITLSAYGSWECFLLAQPYSINLYIWSPHIKKKERKEEESWGGREEKEKSKLVKERTRGEQLEILSIDSIFKMQGNRTDLDNIHRIIKT